MLLALILQLASDYRNWLSIKYEYLNFQKEAKLTSSEDTLLEIVQRIVSARLTIASYPVRIR